MPVETKKLGLRGVRIIGTLNYPETITDKGEEVGVVPRLTAHQMTKLYDLLADDETEVKAVETEPLSPTITLPTVASTDVSTNKLILYGAREEWGTGPTLETAGREEVLENLITSDRRDEMEEGKLYLPVLNDAQRRKLFAYLEDFPSYTGAKREIPLFGVGNQEPGEFKLKGWNYSGEVGEEIRLSPHKVGKDFFNLSSKTWDHGFLFWVDQDNTSTPVGADVRLVSPASDGLILEYVPTGQRLFVGAVVVQSDTSVDTEGLPEEIKWKEFWRLYPEELGDFTEPEHVYRFSLYASVSQMPGVEVPQSWKDAFGRPGDWEKKYKVYLLPGSHLLPSDWEKLHHYSGWVYTGEVGPEIKLSPDKVGKTIFDLSSKHWDDGFIFWVDQETPTVIGADVRIIDPPSEGIILEHIPSGQRIRLGNFRAAISTTSDSTGVPEEIKWQKFWTLYPDKLGEFTSPEKVYRLSLHASISLMKVVLGVEIPDEWNEKSPENWEENFRTYLMPGSQLLETDYVTLARLKGWEYSGGVGEEIQVGPDKLGKAIYDLQNKPWNEGFRFWVDQEVIDNPFGGDIRLIDPPSNGMIVEYVPTGQKLDVTGGYVTQVAVEGDGAGGVPENLKWERFFPLYPTQLPGLTSPGTQYRLSLFGSMKNTKWQSEAVEEPPEWTDENTRPEHWTTFFKVYLMPGSKLLETDFSSAWVNWDREIGDASYGSGSSALVSWWEWDSSLVPPGEFRKVSIQAANNDSGNYTKTPVYLAAFSDIGGESFTYLGTSVNTQTCTPGKWMEFLFPPEVNPQEKSVRFLPTETRDVKEWPSSFSLLLRLHIASGVVGDSKSHFSVGDGSGYTVVGKLHNWDAKVESYEKRITFTVRLTDDELGVDFTGFLTGNYRVDWGDGDKVRENGVTHTYTEAGDKEITFSSKDGVTMNKLPSALVHKLTGISIPGDSPVTNFSSGAGIFSGCSEMDSVPEKLLSGLTPSLTDLDLTSMFAGTGSSSIPAGFFSSLPSSLKTLNLTSMFEEANLFSALSESLFSSLPSSLQTLKMNAMFKGNAISTIPSALLSSLPSAVTTPDLTEMFRNNALNTIPEWWNEEKLSSSIHTDCFSENISASNYGDVPKEWGGMEKAVLGSNQIWFEHTTSGENQDIDITGFISGEYVIDWGDGSLSEKNGALHRYTSPKAYTIKVSGQDGLTLNPCPQILRSTLTKISLSGDNPVTYFRTATSVSEGIFSNCPVLTSIPEKLFSSVKTSQLQCRYMFSGCTALESIPAKLFYSLNSTVKEVLAESIFSSCTKLKAVPDSFFAGIPTDDSVDLNVDGAFSFCTSLTTVPSNLLPSAFSSVKSVDFSFLFANCTGITSLPSSLGGEFYNGAYVLLNSMFSGCTGIKSALPTWWETYTTYTDNYTRCFAGCSNATNWDDVPVIWGHDTSLPSGWDYTGAVGFPINLASSRKGGRTIYNISTDPWDDGFRFFVSENAPGNPLGADVMLINQPSKGVIIEHVLSKRRLLLWGDKQEVDVTTDAQEKFKAPSIDWELFCGTSPAKEHMSKITAPPAKVTRFDLYETIEAAKVRNPELWVSPDWESGSMTSEKWAETFKTYLLPGSEVTATDFRPVSSKLDNDVMYLKVNLPSQRSLSFPNLKASQLVIFWGDTDNPAQYGVTSPVTLPAGIHKLKVLGMVEVSQPNDDTKNYLEEITVVGNSPIVEVDAGWKGFQKGGFEDCKKLTHVSGNLFSNLKYSSSGRGLFCGCSLLSLSHEETTEIVSNFSDCESMFCDCVSMKGVLPEMSGKSECKHMFKGCPGFTSFPEKFNINPEVEARSMFEGCTGLTSLEHVFTTSGPANCPNIFRGCTSLTKIPTGLFSSGWSNHSNSWCMFSGCTGLITIEPGALDGKTMGFDYMFSDCAKLKNIPENLITGVTELSCYSMFLNCPSITTVPDTIFPRGLTDLTCDYMFFLCTGLTAIPNLLPRIPSSSVFLTEMFAHCTGIHSALPDWWTTLGESQIAVFGGCTNASNASLVPHDWITPLTHPEHTFES